VIGKLDSSQRTVTVVGAGISGLLIARVLKRRGYQVTVRESSDRVGGLIQSIPTPDGLVETAAHSFLMTEPMVQHFKELGLHPIPVKPQSKARYIFRDGKARRIPLRFFEILKTLWQWFRPKPKLPDTATLAEWGRHHLGEAATRYLIAPFVTGVFAATPEELQFRLAFPKATKKEKKKMMTLPGGMESWVSALAQELKEEIHLNSAVTELPRTGNVILCTPTDVTRTLLTETHPEIAQALAQITYAPLITITAFAQADDFDPKPPKGVGVLIPRDQGLRILGVLYNSSSFADRVANQDLVSLTVMLGGTTDPDALLFTDDQIRTLMLQELKTLVGYCGNDLVLNIHRWKSAIPIYGKELNQAIAVAESQLAAQTPGLVLFSNWTGKVSLRGLLSDILAIEGTL
jgi:protoporphyrinogen/coproporphyrinogen III oxidase